MISTDEFTSRTRWELKESVQFVNADRYGKFRELGSEVNLAAVEFYGTVRLPRAITH